MNNNTKYAARLIAISIVLGSLIIATGIMMSSETGLKVLTDVASTLTAPVFVILGILIAIAIIASLTGTALAKLTNKVRGITYKR